MKFIAEVGMNHNGNFSLGYELIRQAKYSGADIVKFQLGWRDKPGEINQISPEIIQKLQRWANYFDIELMFSIITEEAFSMIKPFNMKRYKIASRTVKENPALVLKILEENKSTYISLGMWESKGLPFEGYKNIEYLWCKSLYPTEPWDLFEFPKDFKVTPFSGYSDHSIGIDMCLLAIARGAEVIEKHFTLDKSDTTIRDHALSSTPEEFRLLTEVGREIWKKINIGI